MVACKDCKSTHQLNKKNTSRSQIDLHTHIRSSFFSVCLQASG